MQKTRGQDDALAQYHKYRSIPHHSSHSSIKSAYSPNSMHVTQGIPTDNELSILASIPQPERYSKSYSQNETVTHIVSTQNGYVVAALKDGSVAIWKIVQPSIASSQSLQSGRDDGSLTGPPQGVLQFHCGFSLHEYGIAHLCVSPCGEFLVSIGHDQLLHFYNIPAGEVITTRTLPFLATSCSITSTSVAADQYPRILIGTLTGHIYMYTLSNAYAARFVLVSKIHGNGLPVCHIKSHPTLDLHMSIDTKGFIEFWTLWDALSNLQTVSSFTEYSTDAFSNPRSQSGLSVDYRSAQEHQTRVHEDMAEMLTSLGLHYLSSHENRIFLGSLTNNIFISPTPKTASGGTSTSQIPLLTWTSKSQTDWFDIPKQRLRVLSAAFSSDGSLITLVVAPQPQLFAPNTPQIPGKTIHPDDYNIMIYTTKTGKLLTTIVEGSTQYPSATQQTIGVSAQFLYDPYYASSALTEVFFSTPETTSVWDVVQLPSPVTQLALSPSSSTSDSISTSIPSPLSPHDLTTATSHTSTPSQPSSPHLTMVKNPYYLEKIIYKKRAGLFERVITTIRNYYYVFLADLAEMQEKHFQQSHASATATEPRSAAMGGSPHPESYRIYTSPDLINKYRHYAQTSMTYGGDDSLTIVDPTNTYITYPTLFGLKTVRIRDKFMVGLTGKADINTILTHLATTDIQESTLTTKMKASVHLSSSSSYQEQSSEQSAASTQGQAYPKYGSTVYVALAPNQPRVYLLSHHEPSETENRDIIQSQRKAASTSTPASGTAPSSSASLQSPIVVIHTSQGDIRCELYPHVAPKAVENFLKLAEKNYYNDTLFHRVIQSFCIQGGDPTGTGAGGQSIWDREFNDEFHPSYVFDRPGVLAMANRGPNTNGSQFFITTGSCMHLNNKHTIFGRVIAGYNEVVAVIDKVKTNDNDRPYTPVKIFGVSRQTDAR